MIAAFQGKVALVTGGNVGLGFSTAKHLLGKKASVTIACRSVKKCEDAKRRLLLFSPGGDLHTLKLDLSSFASIRTASQMFLRKNRRLDSLILNAGVMQTPYTLTQDNIEQQIGVNHFGHFLLTKLMLPLLEQTAPSTVVVVSSSAHFNSYPEGVRLSLEAINDKKTYSPRLAYGQSKLANILFMQELSKRVQSQNILVNAVHPGAVSTELGRHMLARLSTNCGVFAPAVDVLVKKVLKPLIFEQLLWNPDDGALTQVFAAFAPRVFSERISGNYFHPVARETPVDPLAADSHMQTQLWELSEQLTAKKSH